MIGKPTEVMYIVEDLDAAINFYARCLRLDLKKKEEWGFALLELAEGVDFGLMSKECFGTDFGAPDDDLRPRLSIRVGDLDAVIEEMGSALIKFGNVSGKKGECRAVNVYDPDGNALFLWEDPAD